MDQRDSGRTPRFCTNCGAKTLAGVAHCTVCGHQLIKREEMARLWGFDADPAPRADSDVIDLYPDAGASLQTTTPFSQTRPFSPVVRQSDEPVTAAAPSPPPADEERRGPHGCLLGCIALLLIGAVAALVAWGAVRPFVSDRIEDEIAVGLTNELRQIDRVSATNAGRITLTEERINQDLDGNAKLYEPIEDAVISIDQGRFAVRFKVYGLSSTYEGGLAVEGSRLVVVDPSLSGPAGEIIDADDLAAIFEREIAELLRRSDLRPVSVHLRDGSVVIETEAIA